MTSDPRQHSENDPVEQALRSTLAGLPEFPSPISEIVRQPSEYRSSFALEELTVTFADGRLLVVMFKDLGWQSLTLAGQRAKPAHLYNPLREINVYRRVLAGRGLGTPHCYAAVVDPSRPRYWLFIEKAPGAELYQYGESEIWGHAARWLARLHHEEGVHNTALEPDVLPSLILYDASAFRGWIDRAVEFAAVRHGPEAEAQLRAALRYDEVANFLAALPPSFIHGEFYASNVLVDPAQTPPRVCAVDWELAGLGPAVIDLAALVVGKWTDTQRAELIAAYQSGLPAGHLWASDSAALTNAVDFARLHLAVQWLGWSPDWSPPAAHAHDWLGEATKLGKKLGLT